MYLVKAYFNFYKCVSQPIIDKETDISKNNGIVKKVAYYVGCQDNRSDRYRCFNFVEALRKENIAVDVYNADSLFHLSKKVHYDAAILFREDRYHRLHMKKIISALHSNDIPVIYDTDDFTIENKSLRQTKNILKIIKLCDAVTVTTQFLANLFSKEISKPVYVIKNTINEKQFDILKTIARIEYEDKIKISYLSGTPTHNKDFEQIEESILYVLENYPNTEFHVFGPLELSDKFVPYEKRILKYPYMDYLQLQCKSADMDINIAPLVLNDFNNSKSELKIFEAALLKIPTICSPIEPYKAIIKNGVNGFVADSVEEWKNAFSLLIEDSKKRQQIGMNAFNDFVPMFNVDNEVKNVIRVFEKVKKEYRNK